MDRRRFTNVVCSLTDKGTIGPQLEKAGISVQSLNLRQPLKIAARIPRLLRSLRRENADILQTWLYHADLLGLLVGKAARVPRIAWNLRCSELDRRDHPRRLFWLIKLLSRLSAFPDAVAANTEAVVRWHQFQGYRRVRWQVIPNGFDLHHFRPDPATRNRLRQTLSLGENTTIIGSVARFHPMKDHGNFLKAASLLLNSKAKVHFVLIGQGLGQKNSQLAKLIRELQIQDCVHLLGERHDVASLIGGFDVFSLSSSSGEGFPNALGEAMACAVPCVATNTGGTSELMDETGIIVPSRDPQALANAWVEILSKTQEERREIGERGRRRIARHFSLERVTQMYEDFYSDLIGRSY